MRIRAGQLTDDMRQKEASWVLSSCSPTPDRVSRRQCRHRAAPIGMYEGVGPCQRVVRGFGGSLIVVRAREGERLLSRDVGCARPAGRGRVFPSMSPRGVRGAVGGQARLPRHVFALYDAHDGIVGHDQVGLNQRIDRIRMWIGGSCRSSSSQPGRVRASRGRLGRREASDLAVA